jgi:hypothetical protein
VPAADADATKLRCAHAYEMSQRLKQDGKLQQAREQALVCAQTACPALLSGDCTSWLAELDGAIASVIIDVRDARGQAVPEARVSVDGVAADQLLDGRALPLDPGEWHFRVTLPDGRQLERTLVVVEGKKSQYVRFDVPAPPNAAAPARTSRHAPVLLYGATALGIMGGVGFAYFGLQGRADERELEDSCAPRCSSSDMAALERTYLAADVSLGVGVVALGALGYLLLTNRDEPSRVSASVSSHGAGLSFRERF